MLTQEIHKSIHRRLHGIVRLVLIYTFQTYHNGQVEFLFILPVGQLLAWELLGNYFRGK